MVDLFVVGSVEHGGGDGRSTPLHLLAAFSIYTSRPHVVIRKIFAAHVTHLIVNNNDGEEKTNEDFMDTSASTSSSYDDHGLSLEDVSRPWTPQQLATWTKTKSSSRRQRPAITSLEIQRMIIPRQTHLFDQRSWTEIWDFKEMKLKIIPSPPPPTSKESRIFHLVGIELSVGPQTIDYKLTLEPDTPQHLHYFYVNKVIPKLLTWANRDDNEEVTVRSPGSGLNVDDDDGDLKKRREVEDFDEMDDVVVVEDCGSLSRVSKLTYSDIYHRLKSTYADTMMADWTERTDPQKFIFEDLSISSYLMSLWSKPIVTTTDTITTTTTTTNPLLNYIEDKTTTFIDIGAGNGLLTYLLTAEGYKGKGLDIRSRRIWSKYPIHVDLQVTTIDPSQESGLQWTIGADEKTWLIGNHSDELTPWIPLLARRTRSNFFIIPCCTWDFFTRYQRKGTKAKKTKKTKKIKTKKGGGRDESIYHSYLNYIQEISEKCGYNVHFDRLRIPSTKRIAIIGTLPPQQPQQQQQQVVDKSVEEFIQSKINQISSSSNNNNNSTSTTKTCSSMSTSIFKPRETVEPVRNCTKIPKVILDSIVKKIIEELLRTTDFIQDEELGFQKIWNRGGQQSLNLPGAIVLLSAEERGWLKSQHNGLQTLIRNHQYIFTLQKNGFITLRIPTSKSQMSFNYKMSRPCYFFHNHPNGCPISNQDCPYSHTNFH